MIDHLSLAERYRAAYYHGDLESLRELLTEDFAFAGPAASYRGIDMFLKASDHVRRLVRAVETERVFADGDEACAILTLVVDHDVERFQMVEWYRFEGDRIASIRTIFDTGPFVKRSADDARTAIDPVCHMTVDRSSPAATRAHDGRTFYFCSEGCAIAFQNDPAGYLGRR